MTIRTVIAGTAHGHVTYALDELDARDDAELVGVAEADPELLAPYRDRIGDVPVADDLGALLEQVGGADVVVIAGVYTRRTDEAIRALEAGAHVLADKPISTNLAEFTRLKEAAEKSGRHVSLMFEKRAYATTRALKEIVDSGELGELVQFDTSGPHKLRRENRPDWFMSPEGYGSITADLPIHDVDMVLWLTGATEGVVSAVAGQVRQADPGFQDHTNVLLRAGAATASLEANWLSPEAAQIHGHYRMRVVGELGSADVDWAYNTLHVATHDSDWREVELPGDPPRQAKYFFDALAAGTEPEIGTAASLLATEVTLLAADSAEHDGEARRWQAN
ncbi:Gfo/Idh/MocA family protein [Parenemella sanctibonifatiensis]|uniref:Oxidoreductase n=1 Tax=Parenemella sanctibonifatiensis TaxID=2016505 RepID=A0A255EA92_9ACTN|nr:Gfo/Idh/MocA family oxidoreductase [Parenemella sanctibonifatiensis]OYN86415.1 oxidoreductase [Parenemella sanctibonifatiensis]